MLKRLRTFFSREKPPMPDSTQFREIADIKIDVKAGTACDLATRKGYTPRIKQLDVEERTVEFVISTDTIDRDTDIITLDGWDLAHYRNNPVVLWAHQSRELPIAKSVEVDIQDGALRSVAKFAERESYPFADTVFQLLRGGFLNATSVGFMVTQWEWAADEDARPMGWDITGAELLEYSVVPVPSNPDALMEARSKGIDTAPLVEWCEHALDSHHQTEGGVWIDKNLLEDLRKAADSTGRIILSIPKAPAGAVAAMTEDPPNDHDEQSLVSHQVARHAARQKEIEILRLGPRA